MIEGIKIIWQFIKDYAAVILLAVFLLLFIFHIVTPVTSVDNDGLVIAFIGVLATFIVIGNFAQTTAIKAELNDQIATLRTDLEKITSTANKNKNDLQVTTKNTDSNTAEITNLKEKFNSVTINDTISHSDLAQFFLLFIGEERDVQKTMRLLGKMANENSSYCITLINGRTIIGRFILGEDREPTLIKTNGDPIDIEDVSKISGIPFDWSKIKYAYKLLRHLPYDDHQEEDQTALIQEQNSTEGEKQIENNN